MIAFALGAVTGGAVVFVWLAILGRADARRVAREGLPKPTRHPLPIANWELRRSLVIRAIETGTMGVEDSKQYIADSTLSVNDWRAAIATREARADVLPKNNV